MALCLFTRDRYLPQVDHHHHDHPHHYPPLYWQTYTPSSQTHNSSWIDEKNGMTQSLQTHPPPQHNTSPVSPSHAFSCLLSCSLSASSSSSPLGVPCSSLNMSKIFLGSVKSLPSALKSRFYASHDDTKGLLPVLCSFISLGVGYIHTTIDNAPRPSLAGGSSFSIPDMIL